MSKDFHSRDYEPEWPTLIILIERDLGTDGYFVENDWLWPKLANYFDWRFEKRNWTFRHHEDRY